MESAVEKSKGKVYAALVIPKGFDGIIRDGERVSLG